MRSIRPLICLVALAFISCSRPEPEPEVIVAYADLGFMGNEYYIGEDPFTGRATRDYESGQREMEVDFKSGRMDGLVREWYEDGTQKTETSFANGKRHGSNTYWNEDGTLQKEQVWKEGKLIQETKHTHAPKKGN